MAYQLQPGLSIVENKGALPPVRATDEVFVYPQPSHLNYGSRPNTMLYGTAPYMAGKGAPARFIETSDQLRPQSTSRFNKTIVQTYERNLFLSLTWSARPLFSLCDMSHRVPVLNSKTDFSRKDTSIKISLRSKNG